MSARHLTFILTFSFMSICNASLIEVDIFNDASDKGFATATGQLVWMDLDVNNHLSFNEVVKMTQEQGIYEGWRLPTGVEVWDLWQDTFCEVAPQSNCDSISNFYATLYDDDSLKVREQWNQLIDIMGHTQRFNDFEEYGARSALAFYENQNGHLTSANYDYGIVLSTDIANATGPNNWERICSLGDTACTPHDFREDTRLNISTFLVRSNIQIPEPSKHIWFMLALIIFIKIYRKI
jgi:hypothetical protein